MNLQEYLRDFCKWPKTLSPGEFVSSGLPVLDRKWVKWVKKYRFMEVNADAMRAAVAAEMEEIKKTGGLKRTNRPVAKPVFERPAKLSVHVKCGVKTRTKAAFSGTHTKNYADVNAPEFLSSFAWRQLRFEAFQRYGRRCQCCGASPETGAVLNVDHVKPRRKFPKLALDINNLQVLCDACNHGKCNETVDFR